MHWLRKCVHGECISIGWNIYFNRSMSPFCLKTGVVYFVLVDTLLCISFGGMLFMVPTLDERKQIYPPPSFGIFSLTLKCWTTVHSSSIPGGIGLYLGIIKYIAVTILKGNKDIKADMK